MVGTPHIGQYRLFLSQFNIWKAFPPMLYSFSGNKSKEARNSTIIYILSALSGIGFGMEYALAVCPFIVPIVWIVLSAGTSVGGCSP